MLVNPTSQTARRWYTAELPGRSKGLHPTSFTVKFKVGTERGWRWVRDQSSIEDGTLHYLQPPSDPNLRHFFHGIDASLTVKQESADTPNTSLFAITAPARAARGDESGYSTYSLGTPTSFTRWFALVRLWSPWLAPRQGKGTFTPDKDAVLASFLRHDGLHVVCLAISGVGDVLTVFKHDDNGNVLIQARNDRETEGTSRVLVAVADSFEVANAAVMYLSLIHI